MQTSCSALSYIMPTTCIWVFNNKLLKPLNNMTRHDHAAALQGVVPAAAPVHTSVGETGGIEQFQGLVVPPELANTGDARTMTAKFVVKGQQQDYRRAHKDQNVAVVGAAI